jgi:hypothetical protein
LPKSPSFSSTIFQNFKGISYLFSEVSKFQRHTQRRSKCIYHFTSFSLKYKSKCYHRKKKILSILQKIRSYVSRMCKRYFKFVLIKLSKAGCCWNVSYEKQYNINATLKYKNNETKSQLFVKILEILSIFILTCHMLLMLCSKGNANSLQAWTGP